jgi:hypothetical protein
MLKRVALAALALGMPALAGAWQLFTVAAGVVVTWWLARLVAHPFGPCLWCRGRRGRNAGSDEEQWGWCGRCDHTGQRVRLGARWVHPGLRKEK